jgi:hypothetical protein
MSPDHGPNASAELSLETPEQEAGRLGAVVREMGAMEKVREAQESGDSVQIEAAEKAADEKYMVVTPEAAPSSPQGVVIEPGNQEGVGSLQEKVAVLVSLGKDAAYTGRIDQEVLSEIKAKFDTTNQVALAEEYFDKTIGTSISDNKFAYPVYQALKGTDFARRFAELEDARLKAAGYAGFSL